VAGGIAGGVEAAITVSPTILHVCIAINIWQYPFEYSKTRVQLLDNSAVKTLNPLRLIFQVAKQEGVSALYTGCSTLVIVSHQSTYLISIYIDSMYREQRRKLL
jgi:solute carrier family 25 citrate transporter 1